MLEKEINIIYLILFGIALIIAIAIVTLFVAFNNKKNKLIQENLEAALINQKRQHELELKALRGQMNPHFVHNSLNAIQYYIQQNDVETSENYLAKFSKLMRQFFDYSRQQSISIAEEISLLENYLQIEKLRFEEKLEYSIIVDPNLDIDGERIPSMILQPLVENAVNHGLFHKKENGHVSIQFSFIKDNCFDVCIIDNGIGIKKAKSLNKSIQSANESHSSSVLEERLHFLKESNLWDIDYRIEDRSLKENLSGTEVTLTFNQKIQVDEN